MAKTLFVAWDCINMQSERWRSMDASPFGYPLSRETSRWCCPCVAPCRAQRMLPSVAIKDAASGIFMQANA